jgi:hypothetical protein
MRALRRRYGRAEGVDQSTNSTVVEYAVQEMLKGKSPAAAAKRTVKKLSGGTNMFIGPGVVQIDPKALEAALWDRMAETAIKVLPQYAAGKEHYVLGGTLLRFSQTALGIPAKPAMRARLKALIVEKMSNNPFTSDDGT